MESMGSDAVSGSFRYTPLPDAKSHIRLIEVQSIGDGDGKIQVEITIWPIKEAPNYHAVSYTWGEAIPNEALALNYSDETLVVRKSCADVLRQVHHFKPAALRYFWIDAICINQADEAEKSQQVALMGDLYSRAERVLACLGMHEGDSRFLANMLQEFEDNLAQHGTSLLPLLRDHSGISFPEASEDSQEWSQEKDDCVGYCVEWWGGLSEETACRFMEACDEFGQRKYFWRVWILQELFLARGIRVFCGYNEISLSSLLFWWRMCKLLIPKVIAHNLSEAYLEQAPWTSGDYFLDQGGSGLSTVFEDVFFRTCVPGHGEKTEIYKSKVLELCENRHCQDPRDVVYGTLRLTDWGDVQPDYKKSVFDLAVEIVPQLHEIGDFVRITKSLRLNPDDPDVSRGIALRSRGLDLTAQVEEPSILDYPFYPQEALLSGGGFKLVSDSQFQIVRPKDGDKNHCCIMGPSGDFCAFASPDTQLGDWLVRITENRGIVLRQASKLCIIVGQAFFGPETSLPDEWTAFLLFFHPEDLVILLVQGAQYRENGVRPGDDILGSLGVTVCQDKYSSFAWAPITPQKFAGRELMAKEGYVLPLLLSKFHTECIALLQERDGIETAIEPSEDLNA